MAGPFFHYVNALLIALLGSRGLQLVQETIVVLAATIYQPLSG